MQVIYTNRLVFKISILLRNSIPTIIQLCEEAGISGIEMEPHAIDLGYKNIKVWSWNRSQRKGILASSYQELMTEVMKKFNVQEEK